MPPSTRLTSSPKARAASRLEAAIGASGCVSNPWVLALALALLPVVWQNWLTDDQTTTALEDRKRRREPQGRVPFHARKAYAGRQCRPMGTKGYRSLSPLNLAQRSLLPSNASTGELLASAGDDGNVILWVQSETAVAQQFGAESNEDDKETWRAKHMCRSSGAEIYDLAWSPDSAYFIIGSMDNIARIYSAATGPFDPSLPPLLEKEAASPERRLRCCADTNFHVLQAPLSDKSPITATTSRASPGTHSTNISPRSRQTAPCTFTRSGPKTASTRWRATMLPAGSPATPRRTCPPVASPPTARRRPSLASGRRRSICLSRAPSQAQAPV